MLVAIRIRRAASISNRYCRVITMTDTQRKAIGIGFAVTIIQDFNFIKWHLFKSIICLN